MATFKQFLNSRSEFLKNALTLAAGTSLAQVIPILATPILTRLFTPEDFGVLGVLVALGTTLGIVATGRYELSMLSLRSNVIALKLALLSLKISIIFCLTLTLFIFSFEGQIKNFYKDANFGNEIYILPIFVLALSINNIVNYLNIREKNYFAISSANIKRSISQVVTQFVLGYSNISIGLVVGQIVSMYYGNLLLLNGLLKKGLLKNYERSKKLNVTSLLLYKFKKQPLFSLPGSLFNNLNLNIIIIVHGANLTLSTIGLYAISVKLLGYPSSLIGQAISEVFFREASEEKKKTGVIIKTFDWTIVRLTLLSIPIYLIVYFFSEDLFGFVLGSDWAAAGIYCVIQIPYFWSRFIVSAVTPVDIIMQKQQFYFYFNSVSLFINVIILVIFSSLPFEELLSVFAWLNFTLTILYCVVLRLCANGKI